MKFKYILLALMTAGEMVFTIYALILGYSIIDSSIKALDILNRSVKMFILLIIHNQGSVIMFYWIDQRYPILTQSSDFLKIKIDKQTKYAANLQTVSALVICASSLIPIYINGMTFIDHLFIKFEDGSLAPD
jgi:hypothetical protein